MRVASQYASKHAGEICQLGVEVSRSFHDLDTLKLLAV